MDNSNNDKNNNENNNAEGREGLAQPAPGLTINVYGGSPQILPAALHAEQHYHGAAAPAAAAKRAGEEATDEATDEGASAGGAGLLPLYVPDPAARREWAARLAACTGAGQLSGVVASMAASPHTSLDIFEAVRARFIEGVLPLCPRLREGRSVSNLRKRINDRLLRLTRQQRQAAAQKAGR